MGKIREMLMNVGTAEIVLAVATIVFSAGITWGVMTYKLDRLESRVLELTRTLKEAEVHLKEAQLDITVMKYKDNQAADTYKLFAEALNGVKEAINEVGVTLGRLDEKVKGVERSVNEMKRDR